MKIIPLAFDSLGVRSTCTYVETDRKITIDPGAALGPNRYGLPPHPIEIKRLKNLYHVIDEHAKKSDILTISHYHYDHYTPEADFYGNKILLIKHPKNNINKSQHARAEEFLKFLDNKPRKIWYTDGREFKFGETTMKFSSPVFHGAKGSKLGYVVMVSIYYNGTKLIHASDIQGPQTEKTKEWIVKEDPDILILSGFPTLFLGWRFSRKGLNDSNKNLIEIMEKTKVKTIILDHHLVRDLYYKKKVETVSEKAKIFNKKVITAAEFLKKEPEFLEAKRKELYNKSKNQ